MAAAAAAAAAASQTKKVSSFVLPIGGMVLKRCGIRSMSNLSAAPSYSSSIASPVPPVLHPQVPPFLPFGGSLELMAVPKKKVTPHRKGLRNGPKNLKPIPVIVRCKSCGRVRLPHFYCCSGERESRS